MSKMFFDGVDLSTSSYNVLVHRADPSISGPRRIDYQGIPSRDGGVIRGEHRQENSIQVSASISADNSNELETRINNLGLVLDEDEPKFLRFSHYLPNRQWLAILSSPIRPRFRANRFIRFDMEFLLPDPMAFDIQERNEPDISITSDPDTFSETSGGNTVARPVWTITNTGSSASGVKLENEIREEVFEWSGALANGDMLRINSNKMYVERSTDSGENWTPVMTGLALGSRFPVLSPASQNEFSMEGLSSATIKLVYRNRFL